MNRTPHMSHKDASRAIDVIVRALGLEAESPIPPDPLNDAEVNGAWNSRVTSSELANCDTPIINEIASRCVLLPIINTGHRKWYPLLWADIDAKRTRIHLVLSSGDKRVGYRWESPEGEGVHCYHHAQPIAEVRRPCGPLQLKTHWDHPDPSTPTFCLDADTDILMFFSMLVSIYGRNVTAHLKNNTKAYNLFQSASYGRKWVAFEQMSRKSSGSSLERKPKRP